MNLEFHDFTEDLEWSEMPSQYIPYMKAIVHWFPGAKKWDRIVDLVQQKKGKDITIVLENGNSVNIQFKSRRGDYGDILIEYRHDFDDGHTSPGWINVPSSADFLVYCVPEKAYLIGYKKLHEAWELYGKYWKHIYNLKPAKNSSYVTRNAGVPFSELEAAGVEIRSLKI